MRSDQPTVYIVDDDAAMRDALELLIQSIDLQVKSYSSADTFLQEYHIDQPGCLLLDVRMPGMDGPSLQDAMVERNIELPIIFLTAHGDMELAVRAVNKGAIDCISKPFREQTLVEGIKRAIQVDQQRRKKRADCMNVQKRLDSLTVREQQVLRHVIDGKHNKAIGIILGLSHKTIEFHRSKIMSKMSAHNIANLVRLALSVEPHQQPVEKHVHS